MTKKIIIVIVALIILGGLGYFLLMNKENNTPQDPKLLLGWWGNTKKSSSFSLSDYLEIKDKELCVGYDQGPRGEIGCSKYLPSTIEGDTIYVSGAPYYKWHFRGDTLEIQPVFGQMKKETYKRMR